MGYLTGNGRARSLDAAVRRPQRPDPLPASLELHPVPAPDLHQPRDVRRLFRRRWQLARLGRVGRLGEEALDPAGRVDDEDPQGRVPHRLKVLRRTARYVEEVARPTLEGLAVDVVLQRALEDVNGLAPGMT